MRKAKLFLLFTFILGFSLTMMPPVTGKTAQKSSGGKTTSKTRKRSAKKSSANAAKNSANKNANANAAADPLVLGAKIFDAQCATCHDGGGNTIEAEKTLKMADLKNNGYKGIDDIKARVNDGAGIMPAFKADLKPEEVDAVSAYVWAKAEADWK